MKSALPILAVTLIFMISSPAIAGDRSLTVDSFLTSVREQSPDLEVENATLAAARARASGIRLANPMIGLMQMKESGDTVSGFEFSQEIPFPSKIYRERRVRLLEAEAQSFADKSNRSKIMSEARFAFLEFWAAQERLEILKEREEWLKQHTRLARSTARYDSQAQLHVLEIETESDLTQNERLAAGAELAAKKIQLQVFAPNLDLSEIKAAEPSVQSLSPDASFKSHSSLVDWKGKELESAQAMASLARSSYLPDFFLRVRQFNASEMQPETQEFMFGFTLPFLYFWQPNAEVAEARATEMRAEAELKKETLTLNAEVSSLLAKEKALRAQLENLKEKLLPRSQRRTRLVKNVSQRTMEGLDQHNTVMLSHFDLKLKAIDLHLEHERLMKEITAATGDPVNGEAQK